MPKFKSIIAEMDTDQLFAAMDALNEEMRCRFGHTEKGSLEP